MQVKIINKQDFSRHLNDVDGIYFSAEVLGFIKKTYGLSTSFVYIFDSEGPICFFPVNIIGNDIFSTFKGYVKPVCLSQKCKYIKWNDVVNKLRKDNALEYVEFNFVGMDNRFNFGLSSRLSTFVLKTCDNLGANELLALFDKKTRNQIRKSHGFGFELKDLTIENVDEIYALYLENMKRHGTPPRAKSYFDNLFFSFGNKLFAKGSYDRNKLVGVNLAVVEGNNLNLYFNLSKKEYWNKCINNFLYWNMISDAYKKGVRYFDFGISSVDDIGHSNFKIGFGGKPFSIYKIVGGSYYKRLSMWLKQKKYNLVLRLQRIINKICTGDESVNFLTFSNDVSEVLYRKYGFKGVEKKLINKYFKDTKARVLDVGCGYGRTTRPLKEMGFDVIGVDIVPRMIELAKLDDPSINFKLMSATNLEFPNNTFDYVIFSFNGIDFIYPDKEREMALKEIYRVLKPSGIFILSSHNSITLFTNLVSRSFFFNLKTLLRNILNLRIFSNYIAAKHTEGDLVFYNKIPLFQKCIFKNIGFDFVDILGKYYSNELMINLFDPWPYYVLRKK